MNDTVGQRAAIAARGWLGTPYHHQASEKGVGADCLGLIRGIWREVVGAEPERVPPYTSDWGETGGGEMLWQIADRYMSRAATSDIRPGQILLFRMRTDAPAKHLGLVSRAGGSVAFIHAYQGHGVVESALTESWLRRVVMRFEFPERAD